MALDLLLAVAYLSSRWWPVPSDFIMQNLNLDSEKTVTAWYASAKWMLAAVLSWLALFPARATHGALTRTAGVALPLLFIVLSMDEVAGVHEHVGVLMDRFIVDRQDTAFSRSNYWMVPCGIVLAIAVVLLRRTLAHVSSAGVNRLTWGLGLLILGGGVVEMWQNFVPPESTLAWLQIAAEETLENLGGTVCVAAAMSFGAELPGSYLARALGAPHPA